MRGIGDEHPLAGIAAPLERRPHGHQAAQLAVRAGRGGHGHRGHAGEDLEPVRERVDQAKRALDGRLGLQRVDVGKPGEPRELLVEPGIVLHRAGSQRVEAEIDRVVLLAQARVVAHHLGLGKAGKPDGFAPREPAEPRRHVGRRRQVDAAAALGALFEYQRLLDVERPVARRCGGRRRGRGALAGLPSL